MRRFYWDGFKEEDYNRTREKIEDGVADLYVGSVRIGNLCFDLVTRDYGDGITLDYDLYIGGVDEGYGSKNGYPYTFGGGGNFCENCTVMNYEQFKEYAEAVLCLCIDGYGIEKHRVKEKAEEPLNRW